MQIIGTGGNHAGYVADILFKADYYPFGMIEPGRNENATAYRYAFDDFEADNEVAGNHNSYTTFFRQYDPRLGRWKTPDPVIHPWESPYAGFANNPILYVDPSGDEPIVLFTIANITFQIGASTGVTVCGTTIVNLLPFIKIASAAIG